MLFNSFEFLFFFVFVVSVYYVFPHRFRWIWLLMASYYFYMSWKASLGLLLFASTLIDFFCGLKIHRASEQRTRKNYLYLSLAANLGMLFFFKYFSFFTDSSLQLFSFFGVDIAPGNTQQGYQISQILLPIGISFYTFQTLSYTFDVYRGRVVPATHFGKYALYVSFFPQLVAGPIERPGNLLPQFDKKITLDIPSIKQGIVMMAWGFFLKLVVADRLGVYVDYVFQDPVKYSGYPQIIVSYFFTFQIYYDFAAYTTIALGAAKVMGFRLMENFDRPLYAKNLGEFWRRWHISLMSWFRDYLYRPLVMDFKAKRYGALLIVFTITGLWHGANWTFVIWGLLNGIFLLIEASTRKFRLNLLAQSGIPPDAWINRFFWWFFSFHLIVFSLIFFRSPSLSYALSFISHFPALKPLYLDDPIELALCIGLIVFVQLINYIKGDNKVYELVVNRPPQIRWTLYIGFILVIVLFSIDRKTPFIYFQF
jgi:alginate O-acetyltransferase complex protein AlgI